MDERARRRDDHRRADVDGRLVEPDPVERLAAVLVHGRAGVVRRRPEGGGGVLVDRGARDAAARVALLDLAQRHDRRRLEAGPRHEHRVRDLARDVAAAQEQEAVRLAGGGARRGVGGDRDLRAAAGGDRDRAGDDDLDAARLRLRLAPRSSRCRRRRLRRRATSSSDFETAPRLTFRSEYESETGSVKSFGSFAASRSTSPEPAVRTGRLDRARRVGPGGRCRRDERRLDLPRRPVRMPLEQERGGAGDVRRGHARPVEDGERAAGARERRGEDLAARRADVRLRAGGRRRSGRPRRSW